MRRCYDEGVDNRPTWVIVLVGILWIAAVCVPVYFHYHLGKSITVIHEAPPLDLNKFLATHPHLQPETEPATTQAAEPDSVEIH